MKILFLVLILSLLLIGCGCEETTKDSFESRYWGTSSEETVMLMEQFYKVAN